MPRRAKTCTKNMKTVSTDIEESVASKPKKAQKNKKGPTISAKEQLEKAIEKQCQERNKQSQHRKNVKSQIEAISILTEESFVVVPASEKVKKKYGGEYMAEICDTLAVLSETNESIQGVSNNKRYEYYWIDGKLYHVSLYRT